MAQDVIILDNSCLRHLSAPDKMEVFLANAQTAGLTPVVTEVNLLEAIATPQDTVRDTLIGVLRRLAGDMAVLPWTFDILRQLAQASTDNRTSVAIRPNGIEQYLYDPQMCAGIRNDCSEFNRELERQVSVFYQRARQRLQGKFKKNPKDRPSNVRAFLDDQWRSDGIQEEFANATWRVLGFEGTAPVESLLKWRGWQLLFDAEGSAFFYRAIEAVQRKRVGRMDLLQLVYLGGAGRTLFLSTDGPFVEAGREILVDRYPGATIQHFDETIA